MVLIYISRRDILTKSKLDVNEQPKHIFIIILITVHLVHTTQVIVFVVT